ncbi:MAG: hypothetical protein V1913_18140 [Fibrobacterota bacterium]
MKQTLFPLFLALCVWAAPPKPPADTVYKTFTKDGMTCYAYIPGFPQGNTSWNSICVTDSDMVYVGLADHMLNTGLFKYDSRKDSVLFLGDVLGNGKMWIHQYQAKIHTQIVQNRADGMIYFGTDFGNELPVRLDYEGGHWFRINPKTDIVTNLGLGVRSRGLKSLVVDPIRGRLYACTDPSSHFIIYDIAKGDARDYPTYKTAHQDLGVVNNSHEPRVLWIDKWGNVYIVNEGGVIVKYLPNSNEIIRTNQRLPGGLGTPAWALAEGPAGMISCNNGEYFYGITHYLRFFKFEPEEKGDGKITDLGNGLGDNALYNGRAGTLSLALGKNNKLYFAVGGHGSYYTSDSSAILVEFDPATGKKEIVHKFDKRVTECTGGGCDSRGNVYFAGHRYLVKFNPATLKKVKAL